MSRSCLGPVVSLHPLSFATTRQQSFAIYESFAFYVAFSIDEGISKYPSAKVGNWSRFDTTEIECLFRRYLDLLLRPFLGPLFVTSSAKLSSSRLGCAWTVGTRIVKQAMFLWRPSA